MKKKSREKRRDRADELFEMFYDERKRRTDAGRNGGYDEIMTELLFLILFRLNSLSTFLICLFSSLLGAFLTSLAL